MKQPNRTYMTEMLEIAVDEWHSLHFHQDRWVVHVKAQHNLDWKLSKWELPIADNTEKMLNCDSGAQKSLLIVIVSWWLLLPMLTWWQHFRKAASAWIFNCWFFAAWLTKSMSLMKLNMTSNGKTSRSKNYFGVVWSASWEAGWFSGSCHSASWAIATSKHEIVCWLLMRIIWNGWFWPIFIIMERRLPSNIG